MSDDATSNETPTHNEIPTHKARVIFETEPVTPDPDRDDNVNGFSFLLDTLQEVLKAADSTSKLSPSASKASKEWLESIQTAIGMCTSGNMFNDAVNRDDSEWCQVIEHDDVRLGPKRPIIKTGQNSDNKVISGEAAILAVTQELGLGSQIQFPLWDSGLWVTMKAPADTSLLLLYQRIAAEKISLGRITNGTVFSSKGAYIKSFLVNFAIGCISDITMRDASPERIRKWIKVTDYNTLLWGLACVINPNGYPISQPCTANPSTCNHKVKGLINLNKIHWTDNRALTNFQKEFMLDRSTKHTKDKLEAYQREVATSHNPIVTTEKGLKIHLHKPSLADMINDGIRWVDTIVATVDNAFELTPTGSERDDYILEQSQLQVLREFSYWFEKIELPSGGIIKDRSTIDKTCVQLSTDETVVSEILKGLSEYIESTATTMVGLPTYSCPKCGKPHKTKEGRFRTLIPLEVEQVFFILITQRIEKAMAG